MHSKLSPVTGALLGAAIPATGALFGWALLTGAWEPWAASLLAVCAALALWMRPTLWQLRHPRQAWWMAHTGRKLAEQYETDRRAEEQRIARELGQARAQRTAVYSELLGRDVAIAAPPAAPTSWQVLALALSQATGTRREATTWALHDLEGAVQMVVAELEPAWKNALMVSDAWGPDLKRRVSEVVIQRVQSRVTPQIRALLRRSNPDVHALMCTYIEHAMAQHKGGS